MAHDLRKQSEASLIKEAAFCANVGYFQGALDRALWLQHHREFGLSARQTAWFARVYLGPAHWDDSLRTVDDMIEPLVLVQREMESGPPR